MNDKCLENFLSRQFKDGMALSRASDLLELISAGGNPPHRYIAAFHCIGLIKNARGEIVEFDQFTAGITFPDDYLVRADAPEVLTYLGPSPMPWHPNIRPPFICLHLAPGTALHDLLLALFETWTWNLYATRDEGLNHAAAQWSRHEDPKRFPIDRRPLKRRAG